MKSVDKNENISLIIGKHVNYLRVRAGLTIEGMSFALSISISYILMIERGVANISTKLAKKIANFFEIEVGQLYTDKSITLTSLSKITAINRFYSENDKNINFFIARRAEYSTASFIRNILLSDKFMLQPHVVGEIRKHSLKEYNRELGSEELSRELRRLFEKGILIREDKFGNGSTYTFCLKNK